MKRLLQALTNAVLCAFFIVLKVTRCTDIFADLNVADYCTDQQAMCRHTGSFIHIMCEYYGKKGSTCSKFKEVPLDEQNVDEILIRINNLRVQVANGEAMGKGQQKLPRGYGMMKVFWDSELAAFAKVMINQCLTTHSYSCAASKNFLRPTMSYGFANTTSFAKAIIDNVLLSWEAAALVTTTEEILHSPDIIGGKSRFYIKMVVGDVTHVGCAIGVYEHEVIPYTMEDNTKLSGHMICYFSHYPREGTPVYNITTPIRGIGSSRCGCPPQYTETEGCLCDPSAGTYPVIKQVATMDLNFSMTSRQVYDDDHQKYLNYMHEKYSTESPMLTETIEQQQDWNQLFNWTREQRLKWIGQQQLWEPQQKLESILQQELEWEPKQSIDIGIQHKMDLTPQQELKWTHPVPKLRTGDKTPESTCNDREHCKPKIVMLPIFTIENAPKQHKLKRTQIRTRNTGSLGSAKTKGFKIEVPRNMSLQSKLKRNVNKITQNGNVTFPSYEEHVVPDHPIQRIQQLIHESTHLVETTTEKILEDPTEMARKKVMNLLDLLEEKGRNTQLNSLELIEFDAKMRRVYETVIGKHEELPHVMLDST